jgi:hypothetical protein
MVRALLYLLQAKSPVLQHFLSIGRSIFSLKINLIEIML